MRLTSHGTAGARRRLRFHVETHTPLHYAGRQERQGRTEYLFEVAGDDGRTYSLALSPFDLRALQVEIARISRSSRFQAVLALEDAFGGYAVEPAAVSRASRESRNGEPGGGTV